MFNYNLPLLPRCMYPLFCSPFILLLNVQKNIQLIQIQILTVTFTHSHYLFIIAVIENSSLSMIRERVEHIPQPIFATNHHLCHKYTYPHTCSRTQTRSHMRKNEKNENNSEKPGLSPYHRRRPLYVDECGPQKINEYVPHMSVNNLPRRWQGNSICTVLTC
jgi:hypothetical protein